MRQISVDELPKEAKKLPVVGQHMFTRIYNRTIKTNSHHKTLTITWRIIAQFYKKGKKGNWFKIT